MMLNRQLVLAAVDHTTDAGRTIDVARRIARARGADVDVLHVVPHWAALDDDDPDVAAVDTYDGSSASPGSRLAPPRRFDNEDGVRVRSVRLRGTPQRVIPAYSQLHQATLLVVQKDYGSTRFWRHGRVVDGLARRSPVPVLVLPAGQRHKHDEPRLHRILAPVDFSMASAVALRTALDLAGRHDAHVTLMHALRETPPHAVFSASEALEAVRRLPAQADAVRDRLRRKAAFFGATLVDTEVATGDAGREILEVASRTEPDLVVMGTPHRSWPGRPMFRSTVRRVLRGANVPVLVVPVVAGASAWPDGREVGQHSAARPAAALERVAA